MDDNQEDKLGMYEKVKSFLSTFATALAGVTQIATIQGQLNTNIDGIVDADIKATEDDTGYTEEKTEERTDLETIVLKVARALTAYWDSINSTGTLKRTDYLPSELEKMRDNDLYAAAKRLYNAANPVSGSLSGFNSGPGDVSDLDTKKEAFFLIIRNPEMKRGARKEFGKDVDKLMVKTDELLLKLDNYLATFEAIDSNMYGQYKSARAIDNSGGGSAKVKRGSIDPHAIRNAAFNESLITDSTILEFSNIGTSATLHFYFGITPTSPEPATPIALANGVSVQRTALESGFTSVNSGLNIYNPMEGLGKWRVRIVET